MTGEVQDELHTAGGAPGVAGYQDGCRCRGCVEARDVAEEAFDAYLDGSPQSEIADSHDVSRQTVNTWLRQLYDSPSAARREYQEAQRRAERLQRLVGRTCRVCGRGVGIERDLRHVTCSDECSRWWQHNTVKRLVDPDYRLRHRMAEYRWRSEHAETERGRREAAEALEEGLDRQTPQRVKPGSAPHRYVRTALARDWPIVEDLPDPVVEQVRRLESGPVEASPSP